VLTGCDLGSNPSEVEANCRKLKSEPNCGMMRGRRASSPGDTRRTRVVDRAMERWRMDGGLEVPESVGVSKSRPVTWQPRGLREVQGEKGCATRPRQSSNGAVANNEDPERVERDEKWQTNCYSRLCIPDSQPDRLFAENEPGSGHEARGVGVSKAAACCRAAGKTNAGCFDGGRTGVWLIGTTSTLRGA
jgi:hypothetical protein